MAAGEPRADDGVLLRGVAELAQVNDLHMLHLVDFEEVDDLADGGQTPLFEETVLALVKCLCPETPQKVLLGSFYKPR